MFKFSFQKMFDIDVVEMPKLQGVRTAKEIVQDMMEAAANKVSETSPPLYTATQLNQGWDPHNKETTIPPSITHFKEWADYFESLAYPMKKFEDLFDECYDKLGEVNDVPTFRVRSSDGCLRLKWYGYRSGGSTV